MQWRVLAKCCHLQLAAGPLLASCPSAFPVPSERRLTDKPSSLAAADASPPRENYPAPLQASIPPLLQQNSFSHPNTQRRNRPNNTAAQRTTISTRVPAARELGTNPTLYKAFCTSPSLSLLSCCSRACHLSSVKTPTQENLQLQQWQWGGGCSSKRRLTVSGLKTKLGSARDAWLRPHSLVPSGQRVRRGAMEADLELAGSGLHYSLALLLLCPQCWNLIL